MPVRDRCESIRSGVASYESLRLSAKDAEVLYHRAEELRTLREGVLADLARLDVLKQRGIPVGRLPDVQKCVEWLERCANAVSAGDAKAGSAFGNARRAMGKVAKDTRSAVESALSTLVQALPGVDEAFLKQVETVPSFAKKVADIRARRDELGRGADPSKMSADELLRFLEHRESLRVLASELAPKDFPREVLDFFRAARGRSGASLDQLTDTVREWLAERGQLESIRIRVEG